MEVFPVVPTVAGTEERYKHQGGGDEVYASGNGGVVKALTKDDGCSGLRRRWEVGWRGDDGYKRDENDGRNVPAENDE